jgi:hypothetical protein
MLDVRRTKCWIAEWTLPPSPLQPRAAIASAMAQGKGRLNPPGHPSPQRPESDAPLLWRGVGGEVYKPIFLFNLLS